jgi:ABC-type cobalamin/Fe3+-siderophores transport system ATPase subunit
MTIELTVKNYRCFVQPITITIAKDLTAFTGINNAGKSALMRFLVEFRPLFKHLSNIFSPASYPVNVPKSNGRIGGGRIGGFDFLYTRDPDEVFSNRNNLGIDIIIHFDRPDYPTTTPTTVDIRVHRTHQVDIAFFHQRNSINLSPDCRPDHITSVMELLANTLYIGAFRNALNVRGDEPYFDISVGQPFISQFQGLLTGYNKKESTSIKHLIEQIKDIFQFDSLSIEASNDQQSLHVIVNDKPYKDNELGSGLTQFILVIVNAAMKKPKFILIDEPELNLHPRLQMTFLTTLASYAEGLWFATHSIGLARSSADRVYSVQKVSDGDSIIRLLERTPRLAEFLGEMSFSNYSELGFEKILLVEGKTEVKVFQQLLRTLRKDHRVVILPMRGDDRPDEAELGEIERISTNVFAIIDSERDYQGAPLCQKRKEFLDRCAAKGITAMATQRRATENYFPDNIIKTVFGANYRELGPYERSRDVGQFWGKKQNWRLAAQWPLDQVKATDLGEFLDRL